MESRDGITIGPADEDLLEVYTPERKAGFLLQNAVDEGDYAWAREEVRRTGLDPEDIPHQRP